MAELRLEPGYQAVVIAMKPLEGTYAANALKWGVSGLNVDECRVETEDDLNGGAYAKTGERRDDGWGFQRAGAGEYEQPTGRFPANLLHDGSSNILKHFPGTGGSSAARFFKACPPDSETTQPPESESPRSTMAELRLQQGDVLERLKAYPDNYFDGCLTDPPYGLSAPPDMAEVLGKWLKFEEYKHSSKGFMGKEWDSFVPGPHVWAELLRVLKPGAHALVFAGTRTQDLMGLSLRLAGFELKDVAMYLYGSGFPKSHNISKAIDKAAGAEREVVGADPQAARRNKATSKFSGCYGEIKDAPTCPITAPATPEAQRFEGYGSALKPAYEPILVAMKPLSGTYAQNALEWGVGGLNVDGSRVGTDDVLSAGSGLLGYGDRADGKNKGQQNPQGRFPANLLLDGSPEVLEHFPQTSSWGDPNKKHVRQSDTNRNAYHLFNPKGQSVGQLYGDSGSAARFFQACPLDGPEPQPRVRYCAKASKRERNAGLEEPNTHPTLKPLSLTEYLARLILPPERDTPRRLINPYSGSGSEAIGAFHADWDEVTSIEREEEYVEIARARVSHHCGLYVDIKD